MNDVYDDLAELLYAEYNKQFPAAKKLADKAMQVAQGRGHIKTLLGRRARFDAWESAEWGVKEPAVFDRREAVEKWGRIKRAGTHKALNRLLQGSAADIMKMAMVQMVDEGVTNVLGVPLMTVHDELVWSVPQTKEGLEAIDEAGRIMCGFDLKIPLAIDDERGENWGSVK